MITVVICTHNRCDLLFSTIDSLNSANRPVNVPVEIEILVVANACSDSTVERLEQYVATRTNKQLQLKYKEEPAAGKSYALNRAIQIVKKGFLCFIDDDQKVDKKFLTAIHDATGTHKNLEIFCGKLLPDWTGKEPKWVHDTGQYRIFPFPIPVFDLGNKATPITKGSPHPPGGNLFIHRSVFEKVGHFSTQLGPSGHNLAGSEDSDFILRALDAGVSIKYMPEIVQYHYVDQARLKLGFLVKMSYQRTRTLTQIKFNHADKVPYYLWRKLAEYILQGVFSLSWQRTRFFSMRVAATLGEIAGFINSKHS